MINYPTTNIDMDSSSQKQCCQVDAIVLQDLNVGETQFQRHVCLIICRIPLFEITQRFKYDHYRGKTVYNAAFTI